MTSEWARDQNESVNSTRRRTERALDAVADGDDERVRAELTAVWGLLGESPPSTATVSIELP